MKHLPTAPTASTDPIKLTGTIMEARESGPGRWTVTILSRLGRWYSGPAPSSASGPVVGAEITLLIVPSPGFCRSGIQSSCHRQAGGQYGHEKNHLMTDLVPARL